MDFKQWDGFNKAGEWTKEIDVRGFIQNNYTPYEGNSNFQNFTKKKEIMEVFQMQIVKLLLQ